MQAREIETMKLRYALLNKKMDEVDEMDKLCELYKVPCFLMKRTLFVFECFSFFRRYRNDVKTQKETFFHRFQDMLNMHSYPGDSAYFEIC